MKLNSAFAEAMNLIHSPLKRKPFILKQRIITRRNDCVLIYMYYSPDGQADKTCTCFSGSKSDELLVSLLFKFKNESRLGCRVPCGVSMGLEPTIVSFKEKCLTN